MVCARRPVHSFEQAVLILRAAAYRLQEMRKLSNQPLLKGSK